MNHRPVCRKCEREFRPEKNDVSVEDLASFGSYKVWSADLWKCPGCGVEIVLGFGSQPMYLHFQEDYDKKVKDLKALQEEKYWIKSKE
jgi:hypothetical protein